MFFNRKNEIFNSHQIEAPAEQQAAAEPSFVAHDLVIKGDISTSGDLHINGTVTGHITAQVCVIEFNGKIDGEIHASAIFVHGTVNGPLYASHIHVFPGGRVRGDINYDTITIDNGADVLGHFKHNVPTPVHQRQPTPTTPSPSFSGPPARVATPENHSPSIFDDYFPVAEEPHENGRFTPIKVVKSQSR